MRRLLFILFLLYCVTVLFAQHKSIPSTKSKEYRMKIVDDSINDQVKGISSVSSKSIYPVVDPLNGDKIAETTYPFFANSIVRDQIVYDPFSEKIYFSPMIWPNSVGNRSVNLIVGDGVNYTAHELPAGTDLNRTGWPQIDIPLTGPLGGSGVVGIVAHMPNSLFLWDGFGFTSTQFEPNTDPGLAFSGDNIYVNCSGNRSMYSWFKSSDFGIMFLPVGTIADFSPPLYFSTTGSPEIDFAKSPNEQHLVMVATLSGNGHAGLGGDPDVTADNADNVFILYSHNGGNSWSAQRIAYDGQPDMLPGYTYSTTPEELTFNLSDGSNETITWGTEIIWEYYPLPENFSQVYAAIDDYGIIHVVMNGYGQWRAELTGETTNGPITQVFTLEYAMPVIYWNSLNSTWKVLSNYDVDLFAQKFIEAGNTYSYPGNFFWSIISPDCC
ncbi:MAG: hypothetical protein V1720_01460 [bacterium]